MWSAGGCASCAIRERPHAHTHTLTPHTAHFTFPGHAPRSEQLALLGALTVTQPVGHQSMDAALIKSQASWVVSNVAPAPSDGTPASSRRIGHTAPPSDSRTASGRRRAAPPARTRRHCSRSRAECSCHARTRLLCLQGIRCGLPTLRGSPLHPGYVSVAS